MRCPDSISWIRISVSKSNPSEFCSKGILASEATR